MCVQAAIGAVVFDPDARVFYYSSLEIGKELLVWLWGLKDQYIAQLESLAVASLYASLPGVLGGRMVLNFVDNQGVLWNLVDGSSRERGCAEVAHAVAREQAAACARPWYEYVASDANIADDPSRGDFAFVRRLPLVFANTRCVYFESRMPRLGWLE